MKRGGQAWWAKPEVIRVAVAGVAWVLWKLSFKKAKEPKK